MKYLLRLASFLLFFGFLSLICLRIPAVQTKIVNSFLQNYVGDISQIEFVNVGFLGSIHLKTILLEHPSARIQADALKLKISPLSIFTKPHFSQVSGKGLQIKILASSENKEESIEIKDNDNLKFEGVLNTLLSLVNLEGCSLSLDALVELPLKQKIQCKISNKNKDSKNLFHDLTFDYHNPQPDCKLRRIQGSGDLQLKLSDNKEEQLKIQDRLSQATSLLPQVQISKDFQLKISQVCSELQVEGLRGDLVVTRAAKALAAFEERTEVTLEDIKKTIILCLRHRCRRDPMESINSGDKVETVFEQIFSGADV